MVRLGEQPPYLPDLGLFDYHVFVPLKKCLKVSLKEEVVEYVEAKRQRKISFI